MSGRQKRSQNLSSAKSQQEALQVARATQRSGQTKEQTRLIAQGIQKGIEQYKKQHKAKLREQDKQKKKHSSHNDLQMQADQPVVETKTTYRQHWLPWVLLVVSWCGFGVYLLSSGSMTG